jgi:hypothetical protein
VDEQGTIYKEVPLPPEAKELLEQQRQQFIAEHGRDPGPDDLLFPNAPDPEQLKAQMIQGMKSAGINPAVIYAFEKTDGLLVTEHNQHLISEADLDAWNAAIEEYEANHGPTN